MSEFNKYSTDGGATFIDVEDSNAVHWADNAILGAKNYLRVTGKTETKKGITFTVNPDKSITLSGTKTTDSGGEFYELSMGVVSLQAGQTYILSSGSNTVDVYIRAAGIGTQTNINARDGGGSIAFTPTISNGNVEILINTNRSVGQSIDTTVYPMIRIASDTDDTFVPYAMTNMECTELLTPQITDVTSALNTIITGETVENATLMVYGHYIQLSFRLNQVDHNISTSYDLSTILPKPLVQFLAASVSNRSGNGGIAWIYKNTRTLNIRVDSNPSSAIDINICYIA